MRRHSDARMRWMRTAVLVVVAAAAALGGYAQTEAPAAPLTPGDLVFVDVYRRAELSTTTQIDLSGNVTLPYVGAVNIAGLTEQEASARVGEALKKILKNPRATVSRSAPRMGTVAVPGRTEEMTTQVIGLNNANATTLCETLQGMSSTGGNVGFDANTNSLIITDTPSAVKNMLAVIGQLDQMQTQLTQVRIDTKIVEVADGAMKELGIRWFARGNEATGGYYPAAGQNPLISRFTGTNPLANEEVGGSGSQRQSWSTSRRYVEEENFDRRLVVPAQVPILGQMFFGLLRPQVDIGILLNALVAEDKAQTMASPWATTVNHRMAHIKMADEWPYSAGVTQSFASTTTTGFLDLGITLDVTPHVYRDDQGVYVQLELKPEVSFYKGMSQGVPIRSVRSSDTVTNVRNGQTLVIGGIVMNEERDGVSHVPGLGKVPVVGALFRHKEKSKERKEMMVFVTPTVYDTPDAITWDKMLNLSVADDSQGHAVPPLENRRESRKE